MADLVQHDDHYLDDEISTFGLGEKDKMELPAPLRGPRAELRRSAAAAGCGSRVNRRQLHAGTISNEPSCEGAMTDRTGGFARRLKGQAAQTAGLQGYPAPAQVAQLRWL